MNIIQDNIAHRNIEIIYESILERNNKVEDLLRTEEQHSQKPQAESREQMHEIELLRKDLQCLEEQNGKILQRRNRLDARQLRAIQEREADMVVREDIQNELGTVMEIKRDLTT